MQAEIGLRPNLVRRWANGVPAHPWLTVAPVLALVALFTIFPFIYAAVTSTRQMILTLPDQTPFVGLKNYLDVLQDASARQAAVNAVVFSVVAVTAVTLLGLLVALLLNQPIQGFGILRALVLLPWAIPLVSAGIIWRLLLHGDFGALNGLLLQLGVVHDYMSWLSSPNLAMYAVALAHIWREFPLPAILFLAGLQLIPGDIVDASRVDGAGLWARFRNITLPYLRAPLLIVLVYETMISVSVFDLVYVLTGGGPGSATTLFSWYAYATTFTFLNPGQGAALSFIMAAFLLALIIMFLRIARVDEGEA